MKHTFETSSSLNWKLSASLMSLSFFCTSSSVGGEAPCMAQSSIHF